MAGLPFAYVAVIVLLSLVDVQGHQALQFVLGNPTTPGRSGFSLLRFRELASHDRVDIVFVGSSHAHRSFDPAIFAAHGFTSFNLGSPSQSPLNTYFLLKRYWPRLQPRIVVMEVFPLLLAADGLESFYDLTINTPFSPEMVEMAWAIGSPAAFTSMLGTYVARIRHPLDEARQMPVLHDEYVAGGYTRSAYAMPLSGRCKEPVTMGPLLETQIRYMERIVRLSRRMNARLILVIAPLPEAYRREYRRESAFLETFAVEHGVDYWDANHDLRLDEDRDFADTHHLNASGVATFDAAFVQHLLSRGPHAPSRRRPRVS